jgi:hypothetical protein
MKMEVLIMSLVFSLPVSTTSYCGSHEQGSPFFVYFSVTSFLVTTPADADKRKDSDPLILEGEYENLKF